MLGVRALTVITLAAVASAQAIEGLNGCGQACYTQVLNNAGAYACAAMDFNCLCPLVDFHYAIRDCASQDCSPGYAPTVVNAANAHCATAAPGVPVPAIAEPTSQAPPPEPTTSEVPTSTSEIPTETPSSSSTTFETLTSSATGATSSATSAASTASTTSAPVAGTKLATGTTSAAPAAATSEAPESEEAAGGLGEAAKIGIGVGIGAVVIAIAAVVACLLLRKRRTQQAPPPGIDRFKISHPMPSDEHAYTHNNNSEYDIGGGDLEMKSRRYEDMLPREEPRQMV